MVKNCVFVSLKIQTGLCLKAPDNLSTFWFYCLYLVHKIDN